MKKLLLLFLSLCLLPVSCNGVYNTEITTDGGDALEYTTAPTTEDRGTPGSVLNVMSFNIYGLNQMTVAKNKSDYAIDCTIATRGPKLNALLRGEAIDIAGLQEVTADWRSWLTEHLDDDYAFVGYSTRDTGEGGIVLYRKGVYSVLNSGVFWLVDGAPKTPEKHYTSNFDRMCTWVVFRINETGEYFLFLDTHLDTSEEAQPSQARALVGQIPTLQAEVARLGVSDCPVILVGDMNCRPGSEPYGVINACLQDARRSSEGETLDDRYSTSPGLRYYPNSYTYVRDEHVIDHIFVTDQITVNHYKMIHTAGNYCEYGAHISDHNAIIASITIPKGEQP